MNCFHPTAALRESMASICENIDELVNYIHVAPDVFTLAFTLPDVTPDEENEPFEQISVTPVGQQEALKKACDAFKQFYIRPDVSTKVTYRLPGIIVLPTCCYAQVQSLVESINELKTEFQQLVQTLGDRDEKFEVVHQALPGLVTLQAYRKITLLAQGVQSVGFTWANKQSIVKLTRQKAIDILNKQKKRPPLLVPESQWIQQVEREINDILNLPAQAQLRQRRPVKTHPLINVRFIKQIPRQQQYKASVPVLLCQDDVPRIKPLLDYPSKEKAKRQEQHTLYAIVPRQHWYYMI